MKSLNQLTIIGHLGNDPEVKELANGKASNFTVATNSQWKDAASGEIKEHVKWHQVTMYNKFADVAQYLQKGAHVYISGQIRTHQWEDKDGGHTRERKILIAREVILLDKKSN